MTVSTSSSGAKGLQSGASGVPLSGGTMWHALVRCSCRPGVALAVLLLAAFAVRVVWIHLPTGTLIFDESYYVNASRVLLGWHPPAGAPYAASPAGLDPNSEHPPLGKVILALSMLTLGDNELGWRLPSLVSGMVALAALYLIVRAAGESAWLGVLTVALLAFDNLAVVHSRIGTLDMMALALMLLAAWLALQRRWAASGVLLAIGTLVKLTAVYGLMAVLLLEALCLLATWREERRLSFGDLRPALLTIGSFALVALGGLWLLDATFTSYQNPLDHLGHMLEYGAALTRLPGAPASGDAIASAPWQWLFNEGQITYLRVDVSTSVGGHVISTYPTIDFRGAMNPVLLGAIPPAVVFTSWRWLRDESRLAQWAIVWGAANYFPYVVLVALDNRVTYLYYFLPVIPALAAATAILLLRAGIPRRLIWGYGPAYLAGFLAYFPFRQLP